MKNRHMPNFVLVTLLLIAVLTVDIPFVRGAIEWSSETQLTTHPYQDTSPAIMQAGNGTIWVVWASNRYGNYSLFYTISSDYGSNWLSRDKRLTNATGHDSGPSIMQAANGMIWVVWASTRTGNYKLFYKTFDGTDWSIPDIIPTNTTEPDEDIDPSIMQASDGTIWVVWFSNRTGNFDLFYMTYDGSTWSSDTRLTYDSSHDKYPSIVQLSNGTIWVVWSSYRTGNYKLFYKTFDGTDWSIPDIPLTVDSDYDAVPSIAQARDGTIWVVWQSDRSAGSELGFDLYYKFNNGSGWSIDERLTYDSASIAGSSIVQINDRRMWIVWATAKGVNFDIYYKTTVVVPGDVNGDGTVDITDLAMIGETYGTVEGDPDHNPVPDLNCDGVIDIYDLIECGKNYE